MTKQKEWTKKYLLKNGSNSSYLNSRFSRINLRHSNGKGYAWTWLIFKHMSQTKKHSVIESLTNIIVGLITSFVIQLFLYPLLNIPVTIKQNIIITIVFFIVSFIRGYVIRRFFNTFVKWNTILFIANQNPIQTNFIIGMS